MESKKTKHIETEIRFVVARGGGGSRSGKWRNWVKVVRKYKLLVIRLISSGGCNRQHGDCG